MECGSTLTLVSLYFVPWTLFWDGSLSFANFSSLKRPKMISNLSFISSSNLVVGYCISTPVCCGLIWLNFIVISKQRSYLNVSIFQEEITLLSLWNGKTVIINYYFARSSFRIGLPKSDNQWWYLLRQLFQLSYQPKQQLPRIKNKSYTTCIHQNHENWQ